MLGSPAVRGAFARIARCAGQFSTQQRIPAKANLTAAIPGKCEPHIGICQQKRPHSEESQQVLPSQQPIPANPPLIAEILGIWLHIATIPDKDVLLHMRTRMGGKVFPPYVGAIHVRINLRRGDACMAQQFLHNTQVSAAFH